MLEIVNLTLKRPPLKNISLSIKPATLFALLGRNGSGKTTLLKTLAGLLKAESGTLSYRGQDMQACSRRERSCLVTLMPQSFVSSFDYTGFELVSMGRFARGDRCPLAVEEALQRVDALHLADRPFRFLSAGEKKRIYIARSLASGCPILLFDEPHAHLDVGGQQELWRLLRELADGGKTVIVANHDPTASLRYCQEGALLDSGSCLASGPIASLKMCGLTVYV